MWRDCTIYVAKTAAVCLCFHICKKAVFSIDAAQLSYSAENDL